MKTFRELSEVKESKEFPIKDIVKDLKKAHNIKDTNKKLHALNALFGKYGTENMNKAIIDYVDELQGEK